MFQDLHKRAIANGVPDLQLIDGDKIQEIEPYCEGLKALVIYVSCLEFYSE